MAEATPKYAWLDREIVPWSDAKIHIRTEAVMHASAPFEGIRAYWSAEQGQLYMFRLPEHMKRLGQSMKMMRMTLPYSLDVVEKATIDLLSANEFRETVHIRPTVYLGQGISFGYRPGEVFCGAFITAVPQPTPRAVWGGSLLA